MDFCHDFARFFTSPAPMFQRSMIWRLSLELFWCLLHLLVSIMHLGSHLIHLLKCYIISSGLIRKYQNLQLLNLRYLAIVVDSEEAENTTKIKHLLRWLSVIGVKYVILYDIEGMLKKSLTDMKSTTNSRIKSHSDGGVTSAASPVLLYDALMEIELLSSSSNKEGAARAASFLCSNYLKGDNLGCNDIEPIFSETDMTNALKTVGYGGPDPDLLLIYGPARCHLGFPAWRIRYTEIVHMGPLKSMKYGAIVGAIYDFSRKHQKYGS